MKKFLLWVLVIVGGIYGFLQYKYPSYSWNQKIVVTVQQPSGEATGSSVSWVKWSDGPQIFLDGPHVTSRFEGEAVVVELGKGKYLFGLIKGGKYLALKAFNHGKNSIYTGSYIFTNAMMRPAKEVTRHYGEVVELSTKNAPMFVTFTDINDPKTVMHVDPDDMDAVLGCSKPQLAKNFPWRAQGRTWRQWYKFEAYREAILNAGEEAGLPADYNHFAALEKLNRAINNGVASEKEPKLMPPPKGYEADKLQLASMWSAIRAKYGKSPLREMYRQHTITAAKLRKTYLERGRDTANDCHRLKSLTLEITDEPVTNGEVEKVLRWFGTYRTNHYRMNGKKCVACPTDRTFAAKIGTGNFKVGR